MSSIASNNCRRCTGPTTMNYVRYVGTKEITTIVTARLIINYKLACIMSTTAGGRRIKLKMKMMTK